MLKARKQFLFILNKISPILGGKKTAKHICEWYILICLNVNCSSTKFKRNLMSDSKLFTCFFFYRYAICLIKTNAIHIIQCETKMQENCTFAFQTLSVILDKEHDHYLQQWGSSKHCIKCNSLQKWNKKN